MSLATVKSAAEAELGGGPAREGPDRLEIARKGAREGPDRLEIARKGPDRPRNRPQRP